MSDAFDVDQPNRLAPARRLGALVAAGPLDPAEAVGVAIAVAARLHRADQLGLATAPFDPRDVVVAPDGSVALPVPVIGSVRGPSASSALLALDTCRVAGGSAHPELAAVISATEAVAREHPTMRAVHVAARLTVAVPHHRPPAVDRAVGVHLHPPASRDPGSFATADRERSSAAPGQRMRHPEQRHDRSPTATDTGTRSGARPAAHRRRGVTDPGVDPRLVHLLAVVAATLAVLALLGLV